MVFVAEVVVADMAAASRSLGCIGCNFAGRIQGTVHHIVVVHRKIDHIAAVDYSLHTAGMVVQVERIGLLAEKYLHVARNCCPFRQKH